MHDFPVDLPDAPPPAPHDLRWTASIIGLVAAGLLATNAISLSEWAGELPPSERVVRFVAVVDGWRAFTDRTGLAAPRAAMHSVWKKLENARFPGQEPAAATSTTG
jgi:hypothetical protein